MFLSRRGSLGTALGLVVLLGPLSPTAVAQFGAAIGPLGAGGGFAGGFAGAALLRSPMSFGMGGGRGGFGYGSLMRGGMGGYGLIGGSALAGAGLGYGLGFGSGLYSTQWMMNPYQGYLQGAASTTNANAQFRKIIQQARLTRQEAIRSSIQTRRAMIEEADWERAHMPDPEKLRQEALRREIDHARHDPPPTDIWSARSLNALLRHLIARQGEGIPGPNVPLSEDIVKHINVSVGNTRGSVALLKDNGNLEWPESLMRGEFQETRQRLNALMKEAYKSASSGNNPSDATLNDLLANYRAMRTTLDANVTKLSPNLYIEAKRFLGEVKNTIAALKDPNVANHFNKNWEVNSRNVAELVKSMREKGLRFAPATDRDHAAYLALHHALAAFDANLPRVTSTDPSERK